MFANIARPSSTAATIDAKLSSASTMSAACLETSVPVMPMATPISANLSAGASFTPSPVIATIAPSCRRAFTTRSLCSGLTRAYTDTSRTVRRNASSDIFSISLPATTRLSVEIPSSVAMTAAVIG